MLVMLLDQQPGRLFFIVAAHAHQCPPALEFVAHQFKLEFALTETLGRVLQRQPAPFVPDNDLARTILFRRNRALKTAVGYRVVFHLHRHALVMRVQAGPLGYSPAFQCALKLQPEVIVQTAGPVFLDHKTQRLQAACTAA